MSAGPNLQSRPPQSERFRFGLFEFDTAARELRREGTLIRLQSQPAQVLACLIERAGQTVTRDELRQALWGDETFVDFDRGLNFCISQIRSALKDDSSGPTYIRTVPKQGYQFIAPVQRVPVLEPTPAPAPPARDQSRPLTLALPAALLAVAIALIAGYLLRPRQTAPPIVAILRFDNETGNPDLNRFTDGLTDTLVGQMTAQSRNRYQVIGNALILRAPRERRDLTAIATTLHAAYVVLGQVQRNNQQVRILAHLIRLPDQTHLWVSRTDATLADPLALQSEVARRIAAEFSTRLPSPPAATH
jgi:DNA-binding winged helix-turn-helix (wHTH) protein/TolB-like protein